MTSSQFAADYTLVAESELRHRIAQASQITMQAGMPEQNIIEKLRQHAREMVAPADALILKEGENPQGAYLILCGNVLLTVPNSQGTSVWTRTVGEGTILGLASALVNHRQCLRATALEPTRMAFVECGTLARLVERDPHVAAELVALVATELSDTMGTWSTFIERIRSREADVG